MKKRFKVLIFALASALVFVGILLFIVFPSNENLPGVYRGQIYKGTNGNYMQPFTITNHSHHNLVFLYWMEYLDQQNRWNHTDHPDMATQIDMYAEIKLHAPIPTNFQTGSYRLGMETMKIGSPFETDFQETLRKTRAYLWRKTQHRQLIYDKSYTDKFNYESLSEK